MTDQVTDGIQALHQQLQNLQMVKEPISFLPLLPSDTIIKGRLIEEPSLNI